MKDNCNLNGALKSFGHIHLMLNHARSTGSEFLIVHFYVSYTQKNENSFVLYGH